MEKIQFKRANSADAFGTLSTGEIGVVVGRNGRERGIVIGTEYGNQLIRQNPFYSNNVVTGITLDNAGTTPKLTITQHTFDGVESTYDLDFVISGTIDTAKKLSSNAGSDTASKCQPIYFSGGKPTNIIQTRGSATTPVWLNGGKIEPITSYSGEINTNDVATFNNYVNVASNGISVGNPWTSSRTVDISGYNWGDPNTGIYALQLKYSNNNWYRTVILAYDASKRSDIQVSSCVDPLTDAYIRVLNGRIYITQGPNNTTGTLYSIRKIG